ncbi:carbohydrate ABC transporter permease [Saccharibacillus kuerlensis]|uniref:Sugar ABC transporter permease n=1 Tax=Saccharibacillus kuerlensis TaxID=459527 RepID=A0ABQ2L4A9_9BACL|nr:carbohydrate ABC transporter permease [Saccharibacillus kuerlensis]GGO02234.1 sugar ABC transporter permease [Saccharibacillus kuerlensis]
MKTMVANARRKWADGLVAVSLLLLGTILIYPFLWMVSVGFERTANVNAPFPPRLIPYDFSLFNFELVFENGHLLRAYWNSGVNAFFSVILSVSSALLGGYAFSRGRFKGKKLLFILILATMMIPFETSLIPMFIMFNNFGLIDTRYPIILPSIINAMGILLCKQFFDQLPEGLRESAKIDGAGEFKIFFHIFMPLAGPITATLAILSFQGSWNSFVWPLVVINSQDLKTVPLFLSQFSQESGTPLMGVTMATAAVSIIPVMVVFLIMQKYIIQSIALSGLKGE